MHTSAEPVKSRVTRSTRVRSSVHDEGGQDEQQAVVVVTNTEKHYLNYLHIT
tara:strand:+ start:1086 stop:1241 length:156 start_codon:yes stop_codon:yes gene_type:complete